MTSASAMKDRGTNWIALLGNPNSGKTALFNLLTGLNQKVSNYPGITVERKIGHAVLSDQFQVEVLDQLEVLERVLQRQAVTLQ